MSARVRSIAFAVSAVALAGAANAASITVQADAASYMPGDTITLTITTDSEGEAIVSLYMATVFDTSVINLAGDGQTTQSLPSGWVGAPLTTAPTSEANGFQSSLNGGAFPASDPGTGISGITRLIVDAAALPGVTTISFGGAGLGNDFLFGTASEPASILVSIVPEPSTALLLAAGLLGLAGRRRR